MDEQQLLQESPPPGGTVSYSDFLQGEFGDADGKDNRRMKKIRDERKVSAARPLREEM